MVFKELFICCIFVYFIFKSFTKINSYKTETFEKKNIQIYSIKEVLWVSSKRFSIFICIFFQIKNKRIYGVFSLLGISAKGLDIFLKKKYTEIILSITEIILSITGNDTVNYRIRLLVNQGYYDNIQVRLLINQGE